MRRVAVERLNFGAHGDFFLMILDMLCPLYQTAAHGARRLIPDDKQSRVYVRQIFALVREHTAAAAHAGTGKDNFRTAGLFYLARRFHARSEEHTSELQ